MQKNALFVALLLTTGACGGTSSEPLPFAEVFAEEETVRLATDPDDPLGTAGDVVVWDDRIAILDALASNVKVFDQDGTLSATIGRLGDGPGEFRVPSSLGIDEHGRLMVLDRLAGRVSTFARAGEYVDEFQFSGGAMGGMAVFSDGTRLLIGALLTDDDHELRSPYMAHIFDLQGDLKASFGRRPTLRARAESPFIGTSLGVIDDELAIWGTLGRNTLLAHSLTDDSVHLADSIRMSAFKEPEWTEAPESEAEILDWVVNYHLLTAVIGGPNLALVRFQSGDPRAGEEWFRYALVSIDPLRTIAVTGRTPHKIQRWIDDELLGVTIESDGEAYLRRYRLQEEAIANVFRNPTPETSAIDIHDDLPVGRDRRLRPIVGAGVHDIGRARHRRRSLPRRDGRARRAGSARLGAGGCVSRCASREGQSRWAALLARGCLGASGQLRGVGGEGWLPGVVADGRSGRGRGVPCWNGRAPRRSGPERPGRRVVYSSGPASIDRIGDARPSTLDRCARSAAPRAGDR